MKKNELTKWLLEEEDGQGFVEYGLIIAIIAIAIMAILDAIGVDINSYYNQLSSKLPWAG